MPVNLQKINSQFVNQCANLSLFAILAFYIDTQIVRNCMTPFFSTLSKRIGLLALLGLSMNSWADNTPQTSTAVFATAQQDSQTEQQESKRQLSILRRSNIIGLWQMHIKEKPQCIEYYNFLENGSLYVKSGKEWSIGSYQYLLPALGSDDTIGALTLNIEYDNNEIDCSGKKEDQSGEVQRFFAKIEGTQLHFCADDTGKECFAQLQKLLP